MNFTNASSLCSARTSPVYRARDGSPLHADRIRSVDLEKPGAVVRLASRVHEAVQALAVDDRLGRTVSMHAPGRIERDGVHQDLELDSRREAQLAMHRVAGDAILERLD